METPVKSKLSGDDVTKVTRKVPVFLQETILTFLMGPLNLVVEDEAVEKFWDHARTFNCPWKDVSPGHHQPLGLYGDAAKYSPLGQKIIGYFVNLVLWTPKSSRMSRWLLFSLENDECLGPESLNPLFAAIVRSLQRCYNGIMIEGKTMHFSVVELRGDWEWHVYSLGLLRSWRAINFCWRCDASKNDEDTTYWDLSDDPGWARTEKTELQFIATMVSPSHPRHPDLDVEDVHVFPKSQ